MKHSLLESSNPIFYLEMERPECRFDSVDAICDHLKVQIESHRSALFIAGFDHFSHTRNLPEGQIASDIRAARNLVFCFGLTLQDPAQLALRPRSMGIAETDAGFVISFMEAPMPVANAMMEQWAMSLLKPATVAAQAS